MPNYVATKSYYTSKIGGANTTPFYVVPTHSIRYSFNHPEGTGKDQSPFESFWFVFLAAFQGTASSPASRSIAGKMSRLGIKATIADSVGDLRSTRVVPTAKRMNPKQRKRLAAKRVADNI
jgi:hypothetical protein